MKRILIIEDNAVNRRLEKDLLVVAGYEVLEAQDAKEGICLVWKETPDLILMDVRLPDMRGIEIAKMLRQHAEMDNVPIVFVTASVMEEGIKEIREIKNSAFMGKPINTRTFVSEIKKYLEFGAKG